MDDEVEGDGSEDPDPSPPKISTCELPPNEDGNKNSGGDEVAPTSPDPSSDLGGEEADGRKDLVAPAVPPTHSRQGVQQLRVGRVGRVGRALISQLNLPKQKNHKLLFWMMNLRSQSNVDTLHGMTP